MSFIWYALFVDMIISRQNNLKMILLKLKVLGLFIN